MVCLFYGVIIYFKAFVHNFLSLFFLLKTLIRKIVHSTKINWENRYCCDFLFMVKYSRWKSSQHSKFKYFNIVKPALSKEKISISRCVDRCGWIIFVIWHIQNHSFSMGQMSSEDSVLNSDLHLNLFCFVWCSPKYLGKYIMWNMYDMLILNKCRFEGWAWELQDLFLSFSTSNCYYFE